MGLEWLGCDPGTYPEIAGAYSGDCNLICTAKCVWDDLSHCPRDADVMCVNDAGLRFPGHVEHWYSSHADALPHYRATRLLGGGGGPKHTHTIAASRTPGEADHIWPWPGHGNSGLNAIYTALALGYERVFVSGLPMDNTGHFNDGPNGKTNYGDRKNFKVWERAIENVFDGRVIFMSGRFT